MTTPFLTPDFLLDTHQARRLYHEYAADLPIIDSCSRLRPELVVSDHCFADLSDVLLIGDGDKQLAMRAFGVEGKTGWDAFSAWVGMMPQLLGSPLYHRTYLELHRLFGIKGVQLDHQTAERIWGECNTMLASSSFGMRGLLKRMQVEAICTADDPIDRLDHHRQLAADSSCLVRVFPSWCPERACSLVNAEAFTAYCEHLGASVGHYIGSFCDLLAALSVRHDYFHAHGCRLSNHDLAFFPANPASDDEAENIFLRVRSGRRVTVDKMERFYARMLLELAQLDHAKGWVQQFHLGRYRHAMAGMMGQEEEGNGSYRTEAKSVFGLASFLSRLNDLGRFPHTIIHSLPMSGDEAIVALCRDFRDDLEAGCIRFGAGWSGCDRLDVMTRRIRMIAESDHLSQLVGPASDSGSISGLVRHDYFRRLLCRVLGQDMANGLLPDDEELVGRLVADVCYGNAQRNFRFPQREWGVHDAASQRMLCKG